MIVISLTKVPPSLRGTLTKWYQEIQTGVYVGNVSARIRDELWVRILHDIGNGQATMVFNAKNELGYQFRTTRKDRMVVDFDGIPLMMRLTGAEVPRKPGFSDAARFHRVRTSTRFTAPKKNSLSVSFVSLDIETTGLNVLSDEIISIGAVKAEGDKDSDTFYKLIQIGNDVPSKIEKLTGISSSELHEDGIDLKDALEQLSDFVGSLPIVGYNLHFDDSFISAGLQKFGQPQLDNKMIEIMTVVKKLEPFLDNYRLQTVLAKFQVENQTPHNALADAQATFNLTAKLIKNGKLVIEQSSH